MSDLLKQELNELAEYRASGLTPEQVIELAREQINKEVTLKTTTNYQRIKSMSIEELADFFECLTDNECAYCLTDCKGKCNEGFLKWLESEVKNNG